jgi:UDP-N-acetylglucosamine acyltransferase
LAGAGLDGVSVVGGVEVRAFHLLLSSRLNTSQALQALREEIKDSAEVDEIVRFIETSKRGVIK